MNEIRNILLIGRTGGGKSTLGNVLINKNNNFEETFKESSSTLSVTKRVEEALVEIDISQDGSEKRKYRIIDTIGIGDTELTPQGVLVRLAEIATRVKNEGLNHVLFITQGRFTEKEIEAYDLLSSIIFDRDVLKYTTVVRTNFPNFEDGEVCANDRAQLRMQNAQLAHILGSVNIIYVDNPPLEGRPRAIEVNKEIREESRKRLLTYLATCQGNYRPSNIDTLDERVQDYKTNEQKLKEKMKELEKARKEQEEEFRKKLADLKEEQARELRENRIKFEEDVRKVKVEGEENLRKTKTEMEEKQRRDMEDLERRNQERERQIRDAHEREARSIREAGEQQMRTLQSQIQQSNQETERLRKELSEKGNSSADMITAMMAQMKADDKKWEERREAQKQDYEARRDEQRWEAKQQELKLEEKRIAANKEIEQKRLEAEEKERKENYQSTINSLSEQLKEQGREHKSEMKAVQVQLDNQKQAAKDAKDALDAKNKRGFWDRVRNK